MAEKPNIPTDTSVNKLLTELMPEITKASLAANNAAVELSGTEISMLVDTGNESVGYLLKDGKEIDIVPEKIDNPMVRLNVSEDDIKRMIESENLDMLLGFQSDINKNKYNTLNSIKGSFVAEIADDNHTVKMEAIINGAENPRSIFKMSMQDSSALMRKETNPIQLFMSGALKIEGDMAFAMATQPLFS